jgi:hypothetical protein
MTSEAEADKAKYLRRLPKAGDWEMFIERAAQLEYDAGFSRSDASEIAIAELEDIDHERFMSRQRAMRDVTGILYGNKMPEIVPQIAKRRTVQIKNDVTGEVETVDQDTGEVISS